jgi:predicted Zn-dependent protease
MYRFLLIALFVFPLTLPAQEPDAPAAQPASGLAAAESAIAQSDWKTAESKLEPWVQAHPDDARALFDLGYVEEAQERASKAEDLYRQAIAANPNFFEAHLSLGLMLARQGKPGDARPELETATKLNPEEGGPALKARAWRALAQLDQDAHPDAAINELLEALRIGGETPDDLLLTATIAEHAGELDLAETCYRKLLKSDPKSAQANAGLAHLLIKKKQYPEAEKLLRAALEQTPGDPTLTAQLAATLAAQQKPEAIAVLKNLHQDRPQDRDIALMLAQLLADAGDAAGADKLCLELLHNAPEDPALLVMHGQNLVRLGQYKDAYNVFDEAAKLDAANADAWSGLAFAASKTGRPEVTLQALTKRSEYLPEGPSTYFLWATAYDSLHQKKNAISYYRFFLNAAAGKFPDQEWQAKQRLAILEGKK